MNWFDVLLFTPLVFGAYRGYTHGLILALFFFLAVILGLFVAFEYTDTLVILSQKYVGWSKSKLNPTIFIIVFLVIGASIYFIGQIIDKTMKLIKLSVLNKLLGATLGIVQWIYLTATILLYVLSNDPDERIISSSNRNTSMAIPFYTEMLQTTIPKVSESLMFNSFLKEAKEKLKHEKQNS